MNFNFAPSVVHILPIVPFHVHFSTKLGICLPFYRAKFLIKIWFSRFRAKMVNLLVQTLTCMCRTHFLPLPPLYLVIIGQGIKYLRCFENLKRAVCLCFLLAVVPKNDVKITWYGHTALYLSSCCNLWGLIWSK